MSELSEKTTPEAANAQPGVAQASQSLATTGPASTPAADVKNGEVLRPGRSPRRFILPLVALLAVGYGVSRGYDWFTVGRFLVETDNAYVKADTAIIAAKITGYVASVAVVDNTRVRSGDVLATIDPGDYKLAVDAAAGKIATQDATIARLDQQAAAQRATIAQAQAQMEATQTTIAAAQADLTRANLEFERSSNLVKMQAGTTQRVEQATADRDRATATLASARSNVSAAQAAIDAARASLGVLNAQKLEAQRARDELQVALEKAQRDLSFTQVRAPFDGVVGNKAAQPGQFVQPGTRLMALVALDSVYVEANFKETQLGPLKPGQKVSLTVDALAGRAIEGVVESIAPSSGAQYSLLPPENATGNFTKIVQRVPVRIRVPAEVARSGELRPGLSVVADVHTRDEGEPAPTLMGALGLTRNAQ